MPIQNNCDFGIGPADAMKYTATVRMTIDETFDIGSDTRTGVDDNDYQVPFKFTGTIGKLTIKLMPPKLTAAEQKELEQKTQQAKNAYH